MKKYLLYGCFGLLAAIAFPVLAAPHFTELDSDHDKTISAKEAEAWRPLTRVFAALDKNCDGKLQDLEYGFLLTGKKVAGTCLGPRKKK